uniref:Peptide-N4-(N-acetyl-beta-glucosaminyl)asparagine amidase A n=2 Tax=Cajanus cajan TaxID=3821 RepID=A0A151RJN9_CAJCA|nr:Peptide-N4-(N-acetyl-beta-glucosaminyl)asparagine amidase A [Cajanus cajan]
MYNHVLFIFLFLHPISSSKLHKTKLLTSDFLSESTPPTEYFEVTAPIELPKTKPCTHHILHHDFGFTYGQPPVLANYTPPSHCPSHTFSKIVLEWKATCKGRQFDRIFGVWLGGVELLRSCTAEPRATGIVWSVQKDITRYHSLFSTPQTLAVFLGNVVDQTYTGVYHVDVAIYFYPSNDDVSKSKVGALAFGSGVPADLVLPISRNLPLNSGLWFEIENSTDEGLKEFKVPQNAYRAVLEVYVSFHERDEFWYTNPPDEYVIANNLSGADGGGSFREVVVTLDGNVVGAVWPFTVIYTGGINPLLWRPITGIGSFDLPSYDIEITPLLGTLLDGKSHSVGFSVTNALNVWYIDANLHLWLDGKSSRTEGGLVELVDKPLAVALVSDFEGLNGSFWTSATRSVFSSGWVRSSYGNISTSVVQDFAYNSSMVLEKNGDEQTVYQVIISNGSVHADLTSLFVDDTYRKFSLYFYDIDKPGQDPDTTFSISNITLGIDENKSRSSAFGVSKSALKNVQDGHATMVIKGNLVVRGLGETQQDYRYTSDGHCYSRKVGSSNYTILYDKVGHSCNKRSQSHHGLNSIKKLFII